ncbi:hypothetical protein F992_01685 [Acinetobacter modestus]|uniref:Uncharacterized protein n=1 Tax=Acinetobacter modestus TaxID=1776740 RepID=A0ABN0JNY8_9GAMM|nr:hypothetical protein F992_01685 [Acinetobacter modestus]GGA18174.1 hypothetical protein GCM10017554_13760 [Acinetobacter modestus]
MLNSAVNRVANGRHLAARRVVMNTLGSIPSQVWRKRIVYSNPADAGLPVDPLSFEANALSIQDEPNYEYDHLGFAYVLADKFNGGMIHKNNSMNNPSDLTLIVQIAAYNADLDTLTEQINEIPDTQFQEGDLLALMIYEGFIVWFEIVGITGQTLMSDFGKKYVLNRRDELGIDPIQSEVELRVAIKVLRDLIEFRRGEVFNTGISFTDKENNQSLELTDDMQITAQVKSNAGQLIATLDVQKDSDQIGRVWVESIADSSQWPLDYAQLEVTIKQNDVVIGEHILPFKVV